ncbi:transposase [Bradyrhizobium sp. USDA 4474]
MARPLSLDLRERVVASVLAGESCRSVAERFGVAVSSVVKWSQRQRTTGSAAPGKMGGHRKPVLDPHRAFIVERITQMPHLTLHGLINGECFCAYVKHLLLPTLREGDIVILDNLGSHKSKAVRQMIQAAGARLWYLPPYSPDLNPIEQAFSKIKHWMRQAQKRTIEDTWRHIGHLIQDIQPRECANYFANAGYASVKM